MGKKGRKKFKKERPPDPHAVDTAWRLFLAIPLPPSMIELIDTVTGRMGVDDLPIRWVAAGNAHLTLHFLGDTEPERAELLRYGLQPAVERIASFSLGVDGTGVFPNERAPRVIWLGLSGDTRSLAALHRSLATMLRELEFPVEERSFSPHITLGRVRDGAPADTAVRLMRQVRAPGLRQLLERQAEPFAVEEVHLIRSYLGRGGPRYETIARYHLRTDG